MSYRKRKNNDDNDIEEVFLVDIENDTLPSNSVYFVRHSDTVLTETNFPEFVSHGVLNR